MRRPLVMALGLFSTEVFSTDYQRNQLIVCKRIRLRAFGRLCVRVHSERDEGKCPVALAGRCHWKMDDGHKTLLASASV